MAVDKVVQSILKVVAEENGCTVPELLAAAERKMRDTPGAKVTAIMTKPETTIDGKTGDITVARQGVMKGFGQGFRDYVMKGPRQESVQAEINVGQLPEGHRYAGQWAIQVNLYPFTSSLMANEFSDGRITPIIESILGSGAIRTQ